MDEGTLIRVEVVAIVPAWEDQYKAYHLTEHLTQAVEIARKLGSTCAGELVRVGERAGDVERLTVQGTAVTVTAGPFGYALF